MTRVAVIGATGFIGSAVVIALLDHGAEVLQVQAPRLQTAARELDTLRSDLVEAEPLVERLAGQLTGVDVIVNAAGLPDATSGGGDALFGANALLPGVIAEAARRLPARFVHVSSAAVQGRRAALDESPETAPFSPYSSSKALGEHLLHGHDDTVAFRPTSVHGRGRGVTQTLVRVAGSSIASVARPGNDPTPQVLVENVADAIAFVALTRDVPPPIVLQPTDGLTTAGILEVLGQREPHQVPRVIARALVGVLMLAGRLSGRLAGLARRLDMLWFGHRQQPGWLDSRWKPVKRWNEGTVIR